MLLEQHAVGREAAVARQEPVERRHADQALDQIPTDGPGRQFAEGFITANFETDKYKTEKKNGKEIESVRIAGSMEGARMAPTACCG